MPEQTPPFVFETPTGILSGRDRGEVLLNQLMAFMQTADNDAVTPLDFANVSFIDISCADELLCKLLMRIGSGELGNRFTFIQNANDSVRETFEAVLKLRDLAALFKDDEGDIHVLGVLKTPIREALDVVLTQKKRYVFRVCPYVEKKYQYCLQSAQCASKNGPRMPRARWQCARRRPAILL